MKQSFSEKQIIDMTRQEESIIQSKQKYLNDINRVLKDVIISAEGLKEISKKPETVMVKLGPGILVEAKITDFVNCSRAFSDNGYQKSTIKDTIDWLDKKKTNLEEQLTKVNTDLAQSRQKLNQLIGIIKQIEMEKSKNISVK
jgi:prefoldin subunit 5